MTTKVKRKYFKNMSLPQCFIPDIDIIFLSVLILPPDNKTNRRKWSDRQLAAAGKKQKQKRLTGISVKKTRGLSGEYISSIRAR